MRIWRQIGKPFRSRTRPLLRRQVHLLERLYAFQTAQSLKELRAASQSTSPLLARGRKVFSQNDEDGIIEAILERVALGRGSTFIELGVGDGTENNSLNLLAQGWRGAWLGGEDLAFEPLSNRLRFRKCWIDLDNVVELVQAELKALGVSQPDLFSLDLDGNDWHFARAILQAGVRPRVAVFEYNPLFSPSTHWVMPYDSRHQWDGSSYYGASLLAFRDLLQEFGYRLVACNAFGVNAFFVSEPDASAFADVSTELFDLYMPAKHRDLSYPYFGHPVGAKLVQQVIA